MNILLGDTGLVGTTLRESINFDLSFNSKNFKTISDYDLNNSTIYLSCLPATKWLVNQNTQKDFSNINDIINVLLNIKFNRIILISTIDVYSESKLLSNEDSYVNISGFSYGSNRYLFELMVKNFLSYNDLKIFRLPALFNKHIKKNIIFDLINNNNVDQINLNSKYQWYNLDNLPKDIEEYSNKYPTEKVFNLFTEPIGTEDIVKLFPSLIHKVKFMENKIIYDFTTKFSTNGYFSTKENVLTEIKKLINEISTK